MRTSNACSQLTLWAILLVIGTSRSHAEPVLPKAPPPVVLDEKRDTRVANGAKLTAEGQFWKAVEILEPVVNESPGDPNARGFYAIALLGLERNEQARQQTSIALRYSPALVEAYAVRAIAAARMGSVVRANQDLAILKQLDPAEKLDVHGMAKKAVAEALAAAPKESAADLHAALLQAARNGESLDQLINRAALLLKASNVNRLYGDETYSDRARVLAWSLASDPKNPDRNADYAAFLIDELDARTDWVESSLFETPYRTQTPALEEIDQALARQLLKTGLSANPDHVKALLGMARLEFRKDLFANAEGYIRHALKTDAGAKDPDVLWMMRDILQIAAGQQMARAMGYRHTSTWEETIGNTVYEYTSSPTAAGYAAANNADAAAAQFLYEAKEYLRQALRNMPNDARSHDFVGCLAYRFEDWNACKKAWEKAIELDPKEREYRYSLANVYAKLNMIDPFLEQASTGRNMEHTTAATHLQWAFARITLNDLNEGSRRLAAAVAIDPGDARAIAYMAVIAEARGQKDDALALYKAALALEEARARQRGCSWLTGTGSWFVNDLGRAIVLRSRIAEYLETTDPQASADLYLGNAHIETMISDTALKEDVFTAMLPLPGLPANMRQDAPAFGSLMRTSRALGAVQLVKLKKYDEAAKHFRMLSGYDARRQAAGGKAYNRMRDEVWKSAAVAGAAVECFEHLNDSQELYGWRTFAQRARSSDDSKRYIPTSNQPNVKRGRF